MVKESPPILLNFVPIRYVMRTTNQIEVSTLRQWLETGKKVTVLDIRPKTEREGWQIPGSIYLNAYDRLKAGDTSVLSEVTFPKDIPVVTVCAAGRTSQIAANELRKKGVEAYSLQNGMKGWTLAWNRADIGFADYKVIQLRRTGKGCLSYIVASDKEAIVIDASLPLEVYEDILRSEGLNLTAVLETHIHADHLSRSKQLAEKFNVDLFLPAPNEVSYSFRKLHHDDILSFDKCKIKVIATPGHTIESVTFFLNEKILFTGDTLFTNGVGRPDLKADQNGLKEKAEMLFGSLQLLLMMDESLIILPAHSNAPISFDHQPIKATLKEVRQATHLLGLSKAEFIEKILEKLPPTPPNFETIVEKNLKGDFFSESDSIDLEAGANRCAIS